MEDTLTDRDWDRLLGRIKDQKCTPFIGAGACVGTLPIGEDIARLWADEHDYPLTDSGNLARVAQFLAVNEDDIFPKEKIESLLQSKGVPDFSAKDEPHRVLADLKQPIYITTNYDSFMIQALHYRDLDPRQEICRWNQYLEFEQPSVFDSGYLPSPSQPLVYHLHGRYDIPQSLVLTEDDYLDFLVRMSQDEALLPHTIRTALAGTSLLFIGYSLNDWNFRVLFRSLISSLGASLGYTSVAVQLTPSVSDPSDQGLTQAKRYLNKYLEKIQKIKVRIYWGDARQFAAELRDRWQAYSNGQ